MVSVSTASAGADAVEIGKIETSITGCSSARFDPFHLLNGLLSDLLVLKSQISPSTCAFLDLMLSMQSMLSVKSVLDS